MARDRIDIFMETMSDWADAHRQALTKIDSTLATLVQSQDNLTKTVDNLGVKIDKLTDRIDTLSQVTNAQQVIASQQAATVDKLVGLVSTLATKS